MAGPETSAARDGAQVAKEALELVCSGKRIDAAGEYYSPDFVDHVNASTYHGLEGARASVALYQRVFDDLRFEVLQQVTQGNTVASRWALHGTNRGRRVRLTGIVISRIEGGRIVEDFAAMDTLELVRQLGAWRTLRLLVTQPGLLRSGRAH